MKKKKIIIISLILVLIISIFGISFALYTYNRTGSNSKLVVGDIYMHYNETDQSILTTVEGTSEFYYDGIMLNPNMKNQTYEEAFARNELSKCVDFFDQGAYGSYNDGTSGITFCQGTGTIGGGYTFQEHIDKNYFSDDDLKELKELNIVTSDNKVNPIMASQEYQKDRNELSKCADYFDNLIKSDYDNGTTGITYCQGTGTAHSGYTLQQDINNDTYQDQLEEINKLNILKYGGIRSSYDYYIPNSSMKDQTYEEGNKNELTKCVDYVRMYKNKSNNSVDDPTLIAYCKGTGSINGNTFQNDMDNGFDDYNFFNLLESKNVIINDESTSWRDTINPIMASQTYQEDNRNELSKCVDYVGYVGFDFNFIGDYYFAINTLDLMTKFCQGTGVIPASIKGGSKSYFFPTAINDQSFSSTIIKYLYDNNIINLSQETKKLSYFEFTIDGKNTSNKDINYNIKLAHGDVLENKTEKNRLNDRYLMFKLVEVVNNEEVELVDNIEYDSINNNIIYQNTISKNTNNKINHTYRLYMIVDPKLRIGNMEDEYSGNGPAYSLEEYSNLFASIKVNVYGDYE